MHPAKFTFDITQAPISGRNRRRLEFAYRFPGLPAPAAATPAAITSAPAATAAAEAAPAVAAATTPTAAAARVGLIVVIA